MNNNIEFKNNIITLQSSPLFHFSLHAKELFHSNFLAWISDIPINGKELFKNIFSKLGIDTSKWGEDYIVVREGDRLDLSVYDSSQKDCLMILENKVKSLPDYSQLERYNKKKGIKDSTSRILLTMMSDFPDRKEIEQSKPKWEIIEYDNLCCSIRNIIEQIKCPYFKNLLTDYCDFTEALYRIAKQSDFALEDNYFLKNTEVLKNLRIFDLIIKPRTAKFAEIIEKDISQISDVFFVGKGYGRSGPLIDVTYKIPEKDITIGLQIDGKQYRRNILTSAGIEWHQITSEYPWFFKENLVPFKRALKDKFFPIGDTTSMTKDFGKYNTAGNMIFRYQYVNIGKNITFKDLITAIKADIKLILAHT